MLQLSPNLAFHLPFPLSALEAVFRSPFLLPLLPLGPGGGDGGNDGGNGCKAESHGMTRSPLLTTPMPMSITPQPACRLDKISKGDQRVELTGQNRFQ
jgi:hypothetical protein